MAQQKHSKQKFEKIFNENKELTKTVAHLEAELAKSKKPCKCEKPIKNLKDALKSEHKHKKEPKPEIKTEVEEGDCPKCAGVLIKAAYTKIGGEEWLLVRCSNPECKYRVNGKVI